MYPEKPKRKRDSSRHVMKALFLTLVMGIPALLYLLNNHHSQTVDMLLLGVMICSAVWILYYGTRQFLATMLTTEE